MSGMNAERMLISAECIGDAKWFLQKATDYANDREVFSRPIGKNQGVSFKLADMATRIRAAEWLTLDAAWRTDQGTAKDEDYAMAKLFSSETAMWVTTQAVQIHGGMGYSKEMPLERYFRDAKITEIYEGTSEIQRMVIARQLTGLR